MRFSFRSAGALWVGEWCSPTVPSTPFCCSRILPFLLSSLLALREEPCFGFLGFCDVDEMGLWSGCSFIIFEKCKQGLTCFAIAFQVLDWVSLLKNPPRQDFMGLSFISIDMFLTH